MTKVLDGEQYKILIEWNDTATPYQAHRCIHELIEAQVDRTPDAIAVAFKDAQLTYRELNERANRLAHHLRAIGVGPEVLVPIYMDRGPDIVVAILGILKAGAAYVPVDATYPKERLATIVAEAGASIVVSHGPLMAHGAPAVAHVICLDRDAQTIAGGSSANPSKLASGDNIAFALFTSGSTGTPKGVLVTHSNLVNYQLLWERECALSTSISAVCQMTFFSFAVFQGDVVRALCSGKKLVLCPRETLLSPRALHSLMKRERADFAEFVPALLRSLIGYLRASGEKLDFMRVIVVGADRWYLREHHEARLHMGQNTRFIHVYGSSETTLDSTRFERSELTLSGNQPTPIGRPFTNVRAYILDADLQPVPAGEEGELCIGGAGVARGYLNLPELTAEKFRPDPFAQADGARLFRTGDLAKWLPDGNIAFLGRRDHQVKIRGFRVELGEVESALERHPDVETGLVQAVEREPGVPQLVAYCLPRRPPGTTVPTAQELRNHLAATLPEFMLPSHFVLLDSLPLTPSGKINRLALPAPDFGSESTDQSAETSAEDEVERILLRICRHAVGRPELTANDDLLKQGADSMAITGIIAATENAFGVSIEERDVTLELFSSVANLAAYVRAKL